MKPLILICLVGFVLFGCAGPNIQKVDSNAAKTFSITKIVDPKKSAAQLEEENQKLIERKLEEVLNFCLPRLSGYKKKSVNQANLAYWLSMSGMLAGSVAVPALTASSAADAGLIAGLSGLSGATNFAGQTFMKTGLSGSTIAETRSKIINQVVEQVGIASDGNESFETRRCALIKARAACVMYEIAVPFLPEAR